MGAAGAVAGRRPFGYPVNVRGTSGWWMDAGCSLIPDLWRCRPIQETMGRGQDDFLMTLTSPLRSR